MGGDFGQSIPGHTTEQGAFFVSEKRIYWTKMNLDEARESIEIMDDQEVGRWFRAWIVGAGGKEIPADRLQTWALEQRAGYAAGIMSFANAKEFSQKQRDRVSKRYQEKLPEVTAVDSGSSSVAETLPTNNEQRTTNKEQRAKSKEHHSMRTPSARVVWDLWQQLNEQGTGVKHIAWTPAMAAAAKAREAECRGYDFADVVAFALERMAGNAWFKENPDRMTITHFLRPDNFQRYAANYAPKDQP